jgi:hypothetical protein
MALTRCQVDRFHEVIGGTHFQRVDSRFDGRAASDDDKLDSLVRIEIFEQIGARAVWQIEIAKHDIGHLANELDACLAQITRGSRCQTVFRDHRSECIPAVRIVVDN